MHARYHHLGTGLVSRPHGVYYITSNKRCKSGDMLFSEASGRFTKAFTVHA